MKTITVKGVGNVSLAPNRVEIPLTLACDAQTYKECMVCNGLLLDMLQTSLEEIGFAKTDLKTTDFNVSPNYVSKRDKKGNTQSVLDGFKVNHRLKFGFDFSTQRLQEVLVALSNCKANPVFHVNFTVKDTDDAKAALLRSAVQNARNQAQTLVEALGVKLGSVQDIRYSWAELDLYSECHYDAEFSCKESITAYDIHPDDIDVEDSVTVVWEIVE